MLIVIVIVVILFFVLFMTNPLNTQSLEKSRDLKAIIEKYNNDYRNPELIGELYRYCVESRMLNHIVDKHRATVNDFAVVYNCLMDNCQVKKNGHFVPISTLFFASSLDYALSHNGLWTKNNSEWILRYFD